MRCRSIPFMFKQQIKMKRKRVPFEIIDPIPATLLQAVFGNKNILAIIIKFLPDAKSVQQLLSCNFHLRERMPDHAWTMLRMERKRRVPPEPVSRFEERIRNTYSRYAEAMVLLKVEQQTTELCLMYLERFPECIQYVFDQTELLCEVALEKNPDTLQHIREQTEHLCLKAVSKDGLTLRHVRIQTPTIIMKAITQNRAAIKYMRL